MIFGGIPYYLNLLDRQYYAPVLTREQFLQEPYIVPEFFDFGFAFKDSMPDYTTVISGPTKFELRNGPDRAFFWF